MKRLLFITQFLYLSTLIFAQLPNITKVEYYIDTDPGYGLATNVSLTPSTNLDITFNPDVSTLNDGIHQLFVRSQDANDNWSLSKSHTFFKGFGVLNESIKKAEYFFDTDPGYGKATALSFNPATDVDIAISLDVSSLQNGIHNLFVRAQDNAGQWTTTKSHTFYKGIFSNGTSVNIKTVEYFIDTDPGFGSGTKVAFTPGTELDLTFIVDLNGLTGGWHNIFIRAQDENGSWSLINQYLFRLIPTDIAELETSDLVIFPNTSNGKFNIQIYTSGSKTDVEIININGQVLFKKIYYSEIINDRIFLNQGKGIYFVKAITDMQIRIKKLIIE